MGASRGLVLGTVLGTCGCHSYLFSPPARLAPLETAATLPAGDYGVQVEGGVSGAVFGLKGTSGAARVRRGLTDDLEIAGEVGVLHIQGDSAANTDQNAYLARFGVKRLILPFFAIGAGVGGGASAAGGVVSPDVLAILSWENSVVVPFLSLRGALSSPIGSRSVDISSTTDGRGRFVFSPHPTWLAGGTLGARVPIGDQASRVVRASLLAGASYTHLADENDKIGIISLAAGAEVAF